MDIKIALSKKSTEYLADLVIRLLDELDENKRRDFIGKYINAKLVLEALYSGKDYESYPEDVINKVNDFCIDCLNECYFVEAVYDDYWDSYAEDEFIKSEWSALFAEYIRLAILYARSDESFTAYEIFARIFDCLHNCEQNYEMLGTDSPLDYIDVDISDAFDVFFSTMQKVNDDSFKAYYKMFSICSQFKHYCETLLYKYIDDLDTATDVVISRAKKTGSFFENEMMFLILEELYIKKSAVFDKLKISKELLSSHDNFSYYVASGYYERNDWGNAIDTAKNYLEKTTDKINLKLKTLLTDAFEQNGQLREAYDNSLSMLYEHASYSLYKRTRLLAEKLDDVGIDLFFEHTREYLLKSSQYDATTIYMEILSFEGKIEELLELSNGTTSSSNYDILKYSAKSLIFRVFEGKPGLPSNLNEYITATEGSSTDGINDMLPHEYDDQSIENILLSAIDLLQRQIQFHIDAATRSRYAKAAYYLGVVVDIYGFMGKADKGDAYVALLMSQNNRRPAFKDEVKKKLEKN